MYGPDGRPAPPCSRARCSFGVEAAEVRHRQVADVEQRAEERGEEHHLGEDEPAHAPAEREVDLLVVLARPRIRRSPRRTSRTACTSSTQKPASTIHGPAATLFIQNAAPMPMQQQRERADDRPVRGLRYEVVRLGAGIVLRSSVTPRCRACTSLPRAPGHPARAPPVAQAAAARPALDLEERVRQRDRRDVRRQRRRRRRTPPASAGARPAAASACAKQKQSSLRKYCAACGGP